LALQYLYLEIIMHLSSYDSRYSSPGNEMIMVRSVWLRVCLFSGMYAVCQLGYACMQPRFTIELTH
jgi:hypothetical protein